MSRVFWSIINAKNIKLANIIDILSFPWNITEDIKLNIKIAKNLCSSLLIIVGNNLKYNIGNIAISKNETIKIYRISSEIKSISIYFGITSKFSRKIAVKYKVTNLNILEVFLIKYGTILKAKIKVDARVIRNVIFISNFEVGFIMPKPISIVNILNGIPSDIESNKKRNIIENNKDLKNFIWRK